jgi:hypothetical protein
MGKPSIIQKLGNHLDRHTPPSEECHVLYLMAEIRKVLDHDNSSAKYPALRLYSNWCVHTRLDRPSKFINQAAAEIEGEIQACIEAGTEVAKGDNLRRFLTMEALKQSLEAFLGDNHLPTRITDGENWKSFQGLLVEIVSEQPIIAPSTRIARFVYEDDGNGVLDFVIEQPKVRRFKFSQ